ncbi:MAG: hypothetical protein DRR19_13250 [Candidatus Parabeggiatoa sp. nov. 1]|nr:MAG: hypothetical protein DRR19_13250 [Gammaproteobacteria bacterium]
MPLFLIAQTPRAGEENHCLVVPSNLPISEREAFNRVNAAIHQPEGHDYIAVSQTVEQTATTRHGREILVLVGLDVNQLSTTQREEVCAKLKYYLFKFERLVTQTNWPKTEGCALKHRSELDKWGQDTLFNSLPRMPHNRYKDKLFRWFSKLSYKMWIIVLIVSVIIGIFIFKKAITADRQNPTTPVVTTNQQPQKTPVEIVVELLNKQGFSINDANYAKAIEELNMLLCGKPLDNRDDFSSCYSHVEKSDKNLRGLSNLEGLAQTTGQAFHILATKWVNDEVSRDFLKTQLNLDEIDSLAKIVKIRNQLRKLYSALTNTAQIAVYLPLLNNEEVTIAKRLRKILTQSLPEDQALAHYLGKNADHLTKRVKFYALLTHWSEQQFFPNQHYREAENELEELLGSVCGASVFCQIDKLEEYHQAQSINEFIETQTEDKQRISEELGFNEVTNPLQPEKIVEIRNALRTLNAQLDDKNPKRVFLPFFNQADARIIEVLVEEFELTERPLNLLEGLRNKLTRKPYRFFKNDMKNLISSVDEIKKSEGKMSKTP